MKTAISIPDDLFESAERFAERQGLSRSELYATALRHYLRERLSESVTERLNALYAEESNALDPVLAQIQSRALPGESWE
jgi:metal-responsive CopG/Arc/MetJ family transcriptional regulator